MTDKIDVAVDLGFDDEDEDEDEAPISQQLKPTPQNGQNTTFTSNGVIDNTIPNSGGH